MTPPMRTLITQDPSPTPASEPPVVPPSLLGLVAIALLAAGAFHAFRWHASRIDEGERAFRAIARAKALTPAEVRTLRAVAKKAGLPSPAPLVLSAGAMQGVVAAHAANTKSASALEHKLHPPQRRAA